VGSYIETEHIHLANESREKYDHYQIFQDNFSVTAVE
jgi:hypothetical protein